jgi:hypothetical protein
MMTVGYGDCVAVNDEAKGLVISNILAKLQTNDRTHAVTTSVLVRPVSRRASQDLPQV